MSSDEEDVPVIDLSAALEKDADALDQSTAAHREAVLAEALAHAATLEAQYSQPLTTSRRTGVWKVPLALVVFALSAYLFVFPPPWLAGDPAPSVTAQERSLGVQAALYLQVQQVEAFRVTHGRLPISLEEVEGVVPGMVYLRSNPRVFQLVTPGADGSPVIYDSSRPTAAFQAAAQAWGERTP